MKAALRMVPILSLILAAAVQADPNDGPATRPYTLKPDAPPKIVDYWRREEAQKAQDKRNAMDQYRSIRANPKSPGYAEQLAEATARCKQVSAPDYIAVPFVQSVDVGAIGRLRSPSGYMYSFKILQITGKSTMLVTASSGVEDSVTFELKGWDTDGLTDDADVSVDKAIQITGTDTYDSADGATRTVFVVEPFDIQDYLTQ